MTLATVNRTRVGWVDVAKGIAILLVVLHHSVIFLEAVGVPMGPIAQANNVLVTIRMPLFFIASGLFAMSPISGTWQSLWSRKIAMLLWVFVAWSCIRFAFFNVVEWPLDENEAGTISSLVSIFVLPPGGLWFVYALAIFFVVARLTRRISPWILLTVSGVLSAVVGSGAITTDIYAWDNMAMYLVFFLAGCRLRTEIIGAVGGFNFLKLVAVVGMFSLTSVGSYMWDLQGIPGVRLLISTVGVTGALVAARFISDSFLGRQLQFFGKNTLPIYLIHYLVIAAVVWQLPVSGEESTAIAGVLTIVISVLAVAVSLFVYRFTKRLPGLYDAPQWLSRQGTAPSPSAHGASPS